MKNTLFNKIGLVFLISNTIAMCFIIFYALFNGYEIVIYFNHYKEMWFEVIIASVSIMYAIYYLINIMD